MMRKLLIFWGLILTFTVSTVFLSSCDKDNDSDGNGDEVEDNTDGNETDGNETDGDETDSDENGGTTATRGNKVGNLCLDYSLSPIIGTEKVNIKNFRGKVVVINFWGTWCDPCKSELPHFDEVATEYADDVVIIAIHSVQGKNNAEAYVTENYPNSNIIFLYDESGSRSDKYYSMLGCNGNYPYTIILDKNGVITYKDDGVISKTDLISEIGIANGETK